MSPKRIALVILVLCNCKGHESQLHRGPPVVETAPILLGSFLPASMQVVAHLTDLMKYEIRPAPAAGAATTTTTVRPTPHHKPGIYSPKNPLGPAAYFAKSSSYEEYVQRLNNPPQGLNYFDRYRDSSLHGPESKRKSLESAGEGLPDDLDLLGRAPGDLLRQVNGVADYDFVDDDEDVALQRFSDSYDDSDWRSYVIGNKKVPPTKAYVTLLSLYDMLNKESKKLQLNKYGGYTDEVLQILVRTSGGTAAAQLRTVLGQLVERRDTRDLQLLNKIKALLADLDQSNSYINDALRYIPPLRFIY